MDEERETGLRGDSPSSLSVALNRSSYPEFVYRINEYDRNKSGEYMSRRYPGYPVVKLPQFHRRIWRSFSRVLASRKSERAFVEHEISPKTLSSLLYWSHGCMRPDGRGPVPVAGGIQSLELYLIPLTESWLPLGAYHYDRMAHSLARVSDCPSIDRLKEVVPSLEHVSGTSLLWIVVGNRIDIAQKYGDQSDRFLLLEAGHLMQNLCLLSSAFSCSTVPLGAFFAEEIRRNLILPSSDVVLYVGACGRIDRW